MPEEKTEDTGKVEAPVTDAEPKEATEGDTPAVTNPFGGEEDAGEIVEETSGAVDEGDEVDDEASEGEPASEILVNPKLKWYAVHTYSGHENKVRSNLLKRVQVENLEEQFGQVLIPTEDVTEMKKGKKAVVTRKYFPSYILVEMEMTDGAYHLVNQISGVTRFVGQDPRNPGSRPVPLRPDEVDRILGRIETPSERTVTDIPYRVGDHVRVTDGPFSDFNGIVDDVNPERGTLKVMVTIFGRETPVELDFLQVEPL